MIDCYFSQPHYYDHLRPILDALPEDRRGHAYAPSNVARPLRAQGVDVKTGPPPHASDPLLVAGQQDITGRRPIVYVEHGAGQTYCLSPNTRVLTADLRWVRIDEVDVGDVLTGFTEDRVGRDSRRWQPATVLAAETRVLPCHQLSFADGSTIVASSDHLWLKRNRGTWDWLRTCDLQDAATWSNHSSKLLKSFDVWDTDDHSWSAGYLAAAFDGEGSFTQTYRDPTRGTRMVLTFTQRDNAMLATVQEELKRHGFAYSMARSPIGVVHLNVLGGYREVLRFMGTMRPRRLMTNRQPLDGGRLGGRPVELLRNEFIGPHEVVALTTSTGTLIAEGFASHNSGFRHHPGYAGGEGRDRVGLFVCPRADVAEKNLARYPDARAVVVGCPKLDAWQQIPKPVNEKPVVAVTFHWPCHLVPEAGWAFPAFHSALGPLSKQFTVLGHAHPRARRLIAPTYNEFGIEIVDDPEDLVRRADVLVADNTSLMYEWAALERPVVAMNAPEWRRDVEHGLRFWSHVPGPQCDDPRSLVETVKYAMRSTMTGMATMHYTRADMIRWVYGGLVDGHASERAAAAVVAFADGKPVTC